MFTHNKKRGRPSPEDNNGIGVLSKITFSWLDEIIDKGWERPLKQEDLDDVPKNTKASVLYERYKKYEPSKTNKSSFALWWTLMKCFFVEIVFKPGFTQLGATLASFANPFIMMRLIEYIEDLQKKKSVVQPWWYGYVMVFLLLLCPILYTLFSNLHWYYSCKCWVRIRSCLQVAIFRKMLKLSSFAKNQFRTGEIVNLMSVDANRVGEAVAWIHFAWEAPFVVILASFMIYLNFGWPTFAGVGGMIAILPIVALIARSYGYANERLLEVKDERVKQVNEMLLGIRVVKFFAWEKRFQKLISLVRRREYWELLRTCVLENIQNFATHLIPIAGSTITFGVYALRGGQLEASKVFSALALFRLIEQPLYLSSYWISCYLNAYISGKRINKFIIADEVDENNTPKPIQNSKNTFTTPKEKEPTTPTEKTSLLSRSVSINETYATSIPVNYDTDLFHDMSEGLAINIKNATFTWDKQSPISTLRNINLKIKKGQLVCVVGVVGSGKSSLLSSIFGDIPKLSGQVNVYGSIAYCAQLPWIVNATVRDNILFGKEYDEERYKEVCRVCQLEKDFELLPSGDLTEIGEQGINLSGGQKHRISLARACYSDADIQLLDSPLAAVDVHVGKKLFKLCISKYLKGKTVILCTHSLQYLPKADLIIVMKEGEISEIGTYEELIKHGTDFQSLMENTIPEEENPEQKNVPSEKQESIKEEEIEEDDEIDEEKGRIITEEESAEGGISFKIYKYYLSGYGIFFFTCIIAGILAKGAVIGSGTWMSIWSSDQLGLGLYWYFGIYVGIGVASGFLELAQSLSFTFGNVRSASRMHDNMLARILRSPIRFFDQTPVGRILNRFSKDQLTVDFEISMNLGYMYTYILQIIYIIAMVCIVTPPTLLIVIPVAIIYYYVQRYYRRTYRQMTRLESVSRSPVYSQFSSCISGVSTIRAYALQELFCDENEWKIDQNMKSFWGIILINRWLSVRLECLSAFIVFGTALCGLLLQKYINPAFIALSITYSLNISEAFNWFIRYVCDVEAGLISVERIHSYTNIETEAPMIIESNRPPKDWPQKGEIVFENVEMRYREDLDLVLKGVNFRVKPGETIGIVGRTGSGKSSLLQTLFRFVELAGGRILIDGIDISTIGLEDLRSRLCIVPQDPTIFSGTLRSNIDPFNEYDDNAVWRALESCHLKASVERMPLKLDQPISESGSNLSVGEKQLLCLCRALLHKTRIVVLDEATANVDMESDRIIQQTIREQFKDQTVLTIAHRLETIADSDRVMVMHDGRVVEFDKPLTLMNNENSIFYKLVQETGGMAHYLKKLAEQKEGLISKDEAPKRKRKPSALLANTPRLDLKKKRSNSKKVDSTTDSRNVKEEQTKSTTLDSQPKVDQKTESKVEDKSKEPKIEQMEQQTDVQNVVVDVEMKLEETLPEENETKTEDKPKEAKIEQMEQPQTDVQTVDVEMKPEEKLPKENETKMEDKSKEVKPEQKEQQIDVNVEMNSEEQKVEDPSSETKSEEKKEFNEEQQLPENNPSEEQPKKEKKKKKKKKKNKKNESN